MTKFDKAFKYVILNEGAQSNHPSDRGGLTNWGITHGRAREHRCLLHPAGIDIRNVDLNVAKHIYLEDYWFFEGVESEQIAIKLFDLGVNFGPKTAIKLAQETINSMSNSDLKIDGVLGKLTAAAINILPVQEFLDQLEYHVDDRYWAIIYNSLVEKFGKREVDSTQAAFGKGWLRRSNKRYYPS
jgi:lysozyme family protein